MRGAVIVASIPGRLRLRDVRLRDPERCRALVGALRAVTGVLRVEGAPVTGGVLVQYEAGLHTRKSFEQTALAAFDTVFPLADAEAVPIPRRGPYRWQRERRWNRLAKWGMLASFPVSMALAAAGSKKWHAATGGVFSALLLVHLFVHRRHLIK